MRSQMYWCAGGALLAAMTTVAAAQNATIEFQPTVAANGTVALSVAAPGDEGLHGPPVPNAEAEPADASPTAEAHVAATVATKTTSEDMKGTVDGEPETAREPAAIEARGLGLPNGPLSARPVGAMSDDEAVGAEAGVLSRARSWIDPRENPVMRVIGALGLVVGLIVLLKVVMKRGAGLLGQGGRPSGVIEILARYPLGRKQSLVLIKIARRVLLVHQNGTQMATLSEVAEPMEVAALLARIESGSTGRQAQRFRSMLKRFEHEHDAMRRLERDDPFGPALDSASQGEIVDLTKRRPRLNGRSNRRHSA